MAEQKELNLDEMDQVAGGNIITDILKKVVPDSDDLLKKAPLPFPQDRRINVA